ncbi:MAG: glutamyl-tRNA amidotransferase [Hyphomicrobiales bacterium]|nr:MAG: glutamyl-tRNA amidotransferase [Hyphomicrobiales bacterium]
MREQINAALKEAMKAQDKRKMSTLRLINAAIKDRDIAARTKGSGEGVSDPEVLEILAKMIKQRRESVTTYEEAGRLELAEQERQEIDIITKFLPRQLSDDELREACEKAIADTGAESLKDMGKVMGALKSAYAGQMDFAKAGALVKDLLG